MSTPSRLTVGRTNAGYRIALEGRGTLFQSPAFEALIDQCFQKDPSTVVVDLSTCEYLDSTFLGCLVNLHGRYNAAGQVRFEICTPSHACCELLRRSRLDHFLPITGETPELLEASDEVEVTSPDRAVLGRHVEEAHRRLAEFGGPEAAAFGGIARRVANELQKD